MVGRARYPLGKHPLVTGPPPLRPAHTVATLSMKAMKRGGSRGGPPDGSGERTPSTEVEQPLLAAISRAHMPPPAGAGR